MSIITVEVDVNGVLSEETKIEIIKDEYRRAIRQTIAIDKERIFSNAAYVVVQKLVDESFNEDLNAILVEKVKNIISDLSAYSVFKSKDAWDRDESKGWVYLQKAMEDNKQVIFDRVKTIVENYVTDEGREGMIQEMAQEAVYNVIQNRLIGKI